MKIGFLNPCVMAAENQAFASLRVAAQRIGHELVHCATSDEIELCAPDFVLVAAATRPKLADVPHYGVIHSPRGKFLADRKCFENLLTYDGYLTISDTLEKFLRDVAFGAGRPVPIGYYYNTCQRQPAAADLASLAARRALRITYFGTNWDNRREKLFRILSDAQGVEICGPERSWPRINRKNYGGPVDFDGESVQRKYAANGIGLCMLSDGHLEDDIISNRIFEITSVGAIALCCDTPWIRKHFGDSVYYFDQNLPDRVLKEAILSLSELIYHDPAIAIEKARRARAIFESTFAAEIMIENAVKYHVRVSSDKKNELRKAESIYSPFVSVIVRCGARPLECVERAIRSISGQTYGRFEVILVRYKNLDVGPLIENGCPRIESFHVVDCWGGNRSATLWAGLNAVRGEYFAVLDDDDWWFSDHFEKLFQSWPAAPQERFFAYSGSIVQRAAPGEIDRGSRDRRNIHAFGITSFDSWSAVTGAFASNSFVASSDLLHPNVLRSPDMETAQDSYLILTLVAQADPLFSYAATSIFDRSLPDQSGFAEHPKRFDDELTLQLRLFGKHRPGILPGDAWSSLRAFWTKRPHVIDTAFLGDWKHVGEGYDPRKSTLSRGSRFINPKAGKATVHPPLEPWSFGAEFYLNRPKRDSSRYALVAELSVKKGVIGVGLLTLEENDFLFRKMLVQQTDAQTVRIPIADFTRVGRFVIQNWDTRSESHVELLSLRLLAEPAESSRMR